jgi:hypothetical protein
MKKPASTLGLCLMLVCFAPACDSGDDPAADAGEGDDDDDSDVDAGGDDFTSLVSADWTMAPGTEGYWCARVTVPVDTYIQEFRPIAPLGTHHTALSIDDSGGPDETFECSAGTIGFNILFGSGVGTTPFAMPEDIAFKIPAGSQVLLNLHLYNVSNADLTGTSGVEVRTVAPVDEAHQAEVVYVSNFSLSVPPGDSVQDAECTMTDDTTVFGVFPHMHRLGSNMRGVASTGAGEVVLHDRAYTFEEQLNYRTDDLVPLAAGDVITAQCSFSNDTGETVGFGDSSDKEMCVLGVYRYPASGGNSLCFD